METFEKFETIYWIAGEDRKFDVLEGKIVDILYNGVMTIECDGVIYLNVLSACCYDGRLTATLTGVKSDTELYFQEFDWKEDNGIIEVEFCKPYLLPLSSMTEEQLKLFDGVFLPNGHVVASDLGLDYLNSIHVDYRGLIPMGLALDATGLNIY